MINGLGWPDLAEGRRDACLALVYKIINHEVNVPSEGICILTKGGTRKHQVHNNSIQVGFNIDDDRYSFYPEPSQNATNFQALLSILHVLNSSRIC